MSPPSSSFSAPSYSAPFAVVTDTDHSAWLIIATALGLSWSLLFGAIRVFIRWTIAPGVGLDDVSLAAATVSQWSCPGRVDRCNDRRVCEVQY